MARDAKKRIWPLTAALALELAACVWAGFLANRLWLQADLSGVLGGGNLPAVLSHAPHFRLLAAWLLPAAFGLPSLALAFMSFLLRDKNQRPGESLFTTHFKLDAASYLFLPAGFLVLLLAGNLGNWRLALSLLFMAVLTVKSWFLIHFLWRGFLWPLQEGRKGLGARGQMAVVAALSAPLILLAAWTGQSLPASQMEKHYLSQSREIFQTQTSVRRPVEQTQPQTKTGMYPLAMGPFQFVLGRSGVLCLQAVFMAILAGQLFAWIIGLGIRAGPAAGSVGLVVFSVPLIGLSQMALPGALAMLVLSFGLRLSSALQRRRVGVLVGLALICALLFYLDSRFLALGLGLLAAVLLRLIAGSRGPWWALAGGVGGLALAAAASFLGPWRPEAVLFPAQAWQALWSSPVFLLALAAIPLALKRRPGATVQVLAITAFYLVGLCFSDGPCGQASLALAVCLPPWAFLLATGMQALSRPGWRMAIWLPAGLGLSHAWILSLAPSLRLAGKDGVNRLVKLAEEVLRLDLGRLLPFAGGASVWWAPWLIVAGVFLAVLAPACLWLDSKQDPAPTSSPNPASFYGLALLALALAAVLVLAATGFFS